MQPSNEMLAKLRAMAAAVPNVDLTSEDSLWDSLLHADADEARTIARAEMAREILEDLARGECTPGSINAAEFLRAAKGAGEFHGE